MVIKSNFLSGRNFTLFSSIILICFSLLLFLCAFFNWNILIYLMTLTDKYNVIFQILFILINMWLAFIFVLGLAIAWSNMKFNYILKRLDEVCLEICNRNFGTKINYRETDPFSFFSETFNKFVEFILGNRNTMLYEMNNLELKLNEFIFNPSPKAKEDLSKLLIE